MSAPAADPAAGLWECPCCGRQTPNANDIAEGYCGECHWWTGKAQLLAGRVDLVEVAASRRVCPGCEERLVDGDRVQVIAESRPGQTPGVVLRNWHVECLALGVIGHQYGVCSCTGFDRSRASGIELFRRVSADGVRKLCDGAKQQGGRDDGDR